MTRLRSRRPGLVSAVVLLLGMTACGGDGAEETVAGESAARGTVGNATATNGAATPTSIGTAVSTAAGPEEGCAHVVAASVEWSGATATVSATVRSADTGWEKYADRWEVRAPDGAVLGERVLTHPHETEQPFTRSLAGVELPADVPQVTIAAHDSVAGWCGETLTIDVPRAP